MLENGLHAFPSTITNQQINNESTIEDPKINNDHRANSFNSATIFSLG